jgi:hypothetical protein
MSKACERGLGQSVPPTPFGMAFGRLKLSPQGCISNVMIGWGWPLAFPDWLYPVLSFPSTDKLSLPSPQPLEWKKPDLYTGGHCSAMYCNTNNNFFYRQPATKRRVFSRIFCWVLGDPRCGSLWGRRANGRLRHVLYWQSRFSWPSTVALHTSSVNTLKMSNRFGCPNIFGQSIPHFTNLRLSVLANGIFMHSSSAAIRVTFTVLVAISNQ